MEEKAVCKTLTATYKDNKLFLSGPYICEFDIKRDQSFHVKIEQCGIRKITIRTENDVWVNDLNVIFSRVERLLMLFDGVFISISEIKFSDSDTTREHLLNIFGEHCIKNRLSYFSSADFCSISVDKLLNFESILNSDLYEKWEQILNELDIVHQMYLYSMSANQMPVDVKSAFLIEMAEPIVEVVKIYTDNFVDLNPGNKGTTLRSCLKALIEKYGQNIFEKEMSCDNYDEFLSIMINSRKRIMHIKRKQAKRYLGGNESILYAIKMSLLYRKILFELLEIEEDKYGDALKKCVSRVNKWNQVLDKLLYEMSKCK